MKYIWDEFIEEHPECLDLSASDMLAMFYRWLTETAAVVDRDRFNRLNKSAIGVVTSIGDRAESDRSPYRIECLAIKRLAENILWPRHKPEAALSRPDGQSVETKEKDDDRKL